MRFKMILMVIGLVLLIVCYKTLTAGDAIADPEGYDYHVVLTGDTLWGIASKTYPGQHTGEMVFEIRALNELKDPILQVGQVILLPKEGSRND